MTTATMEKELLDLERQYWDVIKSKDARVAGRLSDEPCVVVGASGAMSIDRRSMEGMVKDPSYELKSYAMDPKSIQFRAIDKDNAVVAYKVREELVVEGKPTTLEAYDASMWTRKDGNWVCTLHTESIAGDAFGRDKK
jgi:hypothetical protein